MSDPAPNDSLFRAVRHDHPDVDIVMLPPAVGSFKDAFGL